MKKFKLVRMAALGVAATMTVSLSACSINDNKDTRSNNDCSSSIGTWDTVNVMPNYSGFSIVLPIDALTNNDMLDYEVSNNYFPYFFDNQAVLVYLPYWSALNCKSGVVSAESFEGKCNLKKVEDNVGALIGSCYSLPSGYHLYIPNLDSQCYAVPSIVLEDGTQYFALSDKEALTCFGLTSDVYQKLAYADECEKEVLAVYNEFIKGNTR